MNFEDFNKLSDEEKAAFLETAANTAKQVEDLTAERDSLKNDKVGLSLKIDNLNNQLLRKPVGQVQDVKSPVDKLLEDLQ